MNPLVSIIIPHFNRSQLIKQTLNSIKLQSYKNIEVIIVDDGSNNIELEEMKQLCNQNSFVLLLRSSLVKGPSHCRNYGVKNCKGDLLLFLDSDDLLAPHCVEQRVLAMQSNSNVGVGIFKMATFTNESQFDLSAIFNKDIPSSKWLGSFFKNEIPWNVTCPFWKKTVFEALGGFDEDLLFMEDPDLHIRIIANKQNTIQTFYNLPVDSFYRINNMDNTKVNFYYDSIYYRILFYRKIINDTKFKELVQSNLTEFKVGVIKILKNFLYARTSEFPTLVSLYKSLIIDCNAFNFFEKKRLFFIINISSSKSLLIKGLRFKGFAYKLLPNK